LLLIKGENMIIVIGNILARVDSLDELLNLSRQHAERSRAESGCLAHAVYQDAENPLCLVFVEEWSNREALAAHFAVPASRDFVKAASTLAAQPPKINIYDATPTQI
jgi:quinol monooxygenase YgiN